MQVWNALHAARWKYGTQKNRKNFAIWAPSHNFVGLYIFATKACIDNRKKVLNSNISPRWPHNMANFGRLTAEIGFWGTPANFNRFRVLASLYCIDVAHRRPTKLCTIFGRLLGWYTIYAFRGFCSLTLFWHVQNSLCVQVLRSLYWQRYCMALQQRTSAKLCPV